MRLLADENFNNAILRGLRLRVPDANITRVQDTEMAAQPDTAVLGWAAEHGYIVLTHDVNTMRGDYYTRVAAGLPVPGVFLIISTTPINIIINELELIVLASDQSEWDGKMRYLPL